MTGAGHLGWTAILQVIGASAVGAWIAKGSLSLVTGWRRRARRAH